MVFDGLVGFKRVRGTDGNTLVPDVASSLPAPTANGRTSTFRLRDHIKFSGGRELKAAAVRASLERLFRVKTVRPDLYEGIVDGPACRKQPKRCNLSKGVLTDDAKGVVTIKLRAPDPEFLYKLALPFAPLVAPATAATSASPVLGTGPYRIVAYNPNRSLDSYAIATSGGGRKQPSRRGSRTRSQSIWPAAPTPI